MIDWNEMHLTPGLDEGTDYVIVNFQYWYVSNIRRQLLTEFNGGPEICLQVVPQPQTATNSLGFSYTNNKGPDKSPITITFDDTTNPQGSESKGFMVSKHYPVKSLIHKLCQVFSVTTDITVFCYQNNAGAFEDIDAKDKRTLDEVGISEGTLVASQNSHDKMKA